MAGVDARALAEAARKYASGKSRRELERLLAKRVVGIRRPRGPLLQGSNKWQEWELELLGKLPDRDVAKLTGRTRLAVEAKRQKLRLLRRASPSPPWTPE